ncbi:hypothetical protein M0R45_031235 [Rubus argutus]|uniref:RNase H type-1 domain-containing protein n=1 Tax=Rubus argutus TaxID=59490 RepID=A0AAW1WF94_RUBAR
MAKIRSVVSEYSCHFISPEVSSTLLVPQVDVVAATWCAPTYPLVKINCDGAWDVGSNKAGIGVIVRDSMGVVINGSMKSCLSSSALHSEASTVLEGLVLTRTLDLHHVCFELDSEPLFNAVTKNSLNFC